KNNLFHQFDPSGGGTTVPTAQLFDKDYNNFAPRIALAYDITGKGRTVIRGGWGLFYDAFSQDIFLGHLPWNCTPICPGPAYAGVGPAAVSLTSLTGGALDPNIPVFSGSLPLPDFLAADPN